MGGSVKLIVLDRDGSLGQIPEDFVRSPDDWVPQPGALEAVARLNQAGWRVVVASNQSGLGRGLFDMATLNAVHTRMHKLLAAAGARVDAVFVCPHTPEEGCACRKPEPGLLQQIGQRYGVALSEIRAVGDSLNDVRAADRGKDGEASAAQLHDRLTGDGLAVTIALPPEPFGDWNEWADDQRRRSRRQRRGEEGTGRVRPGAG